MTQTEQILTAFRLNNYKLTLGYCLQYKWGYKFCSRLSDLRKQGYRIDFSKGSNPSENSWTLHVPETNGQGVML